MSKYTPEIQYTDEDWFRKKYVEEELSTREIANLCGISHTSVIRWMKKHGIARRDEPDSLQDSRNFGKRTTD